MTNINCSLDCIYQKDGICNLNDTQNIQKLSNQTNCAYFYSARNRETEKNIP